MKGVPGLLIAVALGITGAFCNWMYLAQKGQELDRVEFIGIAEGRTINPGDKFVDSDFQPIPIPRIAVGNLDKAAPLWDELATVRGMTATRSYSPGDIVLRQHLLTPPQNDIKKLLAPDERVMWLPVDTRGFVSSLVSAGDQVSFIVPRLGAAGPPLAEVESTTAAPPVAPQATEIIGPYRILALGNRLGSREVLAAAGVSTAQENVMAVAVKVVGNSLDEKGQQLSDLLRQTNFQQVQVLLHPPSDAKKAN